jgi:hypothetical protein
VIRLRQQDGIVGSHFHEHSRRVPQKCANELRLFPVAKHGFPEKDCNHASDHVGFPDHMGLPKLTSSVAASTLTPSWMILGWTSALALGPSPSAVQPVLLPHLDEC